MLPYAFILYKTVSQFAEILKKADVNSKIAASLSSRASILRTWWSCTTKKCDYYQVYQAYGPLELTHVGYHAAERLALEHLTNCVAPSEGVCRLCEEWANRLRGELWHTLMRAGSPSGDNSDNSNDKRTGYGFHQS